MSGINKASTRRPVHDVLDAAKAAMQGNEPALLSHTLYSFNLAEEALSISDFDIIAMPASAPCVHRVPPLVLKSVRAGNRQCSGSVFECGDVGELEAVVAAPARAPKGRKLLCNANGSLREVVTPELALHAGRFLVFRLAYKTVLKRPKGRRALMFAGAIQPSDYQGVVSALGLSNFSAKKVIETSVYADTPFSAWFYDPQTNDYFPDATLSAATAHGGGHEAMKVFSHEMNRNTLRARYFSLYVDLPSASSGPRGNSGSISGDDADLGIGASG